MSADELLTPRLRLRPWRPEDYEPMAAINRDPAVTEFLNRPGDAAATRAFLAKTLEHWDEHGFGHWALESREGALAGRLLGFTGVAYPTFLPELASRPELGWRLAREAWGHGFATEAAVAARDDALTRPVRPRSRRLAPNRPVSGKPHGPAALDVAVATTNAAARDATSPTVRPGRERLRACATPRPHPSALHPLAGSLRTSPHRHSPQGDGFRPLTSRL